ncbi:MAG: helix-turn-helix domain-containing protein [Zoogloeaceae bacterium]|jgi:predicted DNA-binding transcriptional regulator AlpA|nr:helix-turn-helix domain-containing protein [Zoogloeaceae bacterium]
MSEVTPDVVILPDGRMDAKNAAAYCGLSVKTLAMKRSSGTGPKFIKIGRVFYRREHLDEWMEKHGAASTAQARQIP